MVERPPDAALRELLSVVAIGRTERVGEGELTLLSVERYRDGFVATFRLHVAYSSPGPGLLAAPPMPELRLEVADDRGGTYRPWPHGGSGGGGRGALDWRLTYRFAPALPRGAREARITVREIAWRRVDRDRHDLVDAGATAGPWTFLVPLA